MDLAKYRTLFISEAREHLQAMARAIVHLQKQPGKDLFNEIFRCAHSLKGMAASMGFEKVYQSTTSVWSRFLPRPSSLLV